MKDHAHFSEAIASYAIGAGEPHDAADVLDHVAACDPCRELFREMRDVAADLALAPAPIAVPAALSARIMDTVAVDRPTTASVPEYARDARDARDARRAAGRGARTRRLLVVAAMLTVAALGATNVRLSGDLRSARARDHSAAQAAGWLGDPRATKTVLTGQGRGSLALLVRPDGDALLVGSGLQVPDGRALELWLISPDGVPTPGPLFRPSVDQGTALVDLKIDLDEVTTIAITVEERRVQRPTSAPIFQAVLARPTRI